MYSEQKWLKSINIYLPKLRSKDSQNSTGQAVCLLINFSRNFDFKKSGQYQLFPRNHGHSPTIFILVGECPITIEEKCHIQMYVWLLKMFRFWNPRPFLENSEKNWDIQGGPKPCLLMNFACNLSLENQVIINIQNEYGRWVSLISGKKLILTRFFKIKITGKIYS